MRGAPTRTRVNYETRRLLLKLFYRSARDGRDALAMQALAPLAEPYVAWTGMALRPSALASVLNDIVVHERRTIVELGGGISTLFIARMLREREGRLITVEHDAEWADTLRRLLREEGSDASVGVVTAELAPTDLSWSGEHWYSEAALAELEIGDGIDLLIVDGPAVEDPGDEDRRHARYPALPYFADSLSPDCAVVLDDIQRLGEQEIVSRWEKEFALSFDRRFVEGGIAIAHRGAAYLV